MFQNPLKLRPNKTRWSLFLILAVILRLSIAQSVFYVQDSLVTYSPGTPSKYLLTSLNPGWISSTKYAMGLWLNKISWNNTPNGWDIMATIVQNVSDNSCRSLLIQADFNQSTCFVASSPDNWAGPLTPWENNLNGSELAPIGTWVFFATGVDSIAQMNYGFRYYLSSDSSTSQYMGSRNDSFYTLNYTNTALYVGGIADPNYVNGGQYGKANGYMQYMRLFLDYTPTTVDEFLNIALMYYESHLRLFYFESDPETNNNQTFIVSTIGVSDQTNTTGFKGFDSQISTQDVSFGPYNILMCRSGQIASTPLNSNISQKGLLVALHFYPYPSTQTTQTIFSIRDTVTNVISLRFDYFTSSGTLNVWINPVSSTASTTPYYAFSSSIVSAAPVTTSSWNRVIVELIQTQPLETGAGFSSGRIWVNGIVTSRAYFGNFATGDPAIADGNNAALDVCGAYDSASANLVSTTLTGDFDILNLLLITGSEGVFQNSSDPSCIWRVFIAPSQATCLMCASGYFMQDDQKCVSSSPGSSYFLHNPTNSYQKCYYSQYYNLSSGVCSECTDDGQFILAPQCVNCDSTCRKCTGTAANQCAACYAGGYLSINSTGSYCLQACPSGYIPNHGSNQCVTSLVSQAQSETLVVAPVAMSTAFIAASLFSGGFSVNMMMCLIATESLANMQYLNINHSNIASTFYTTISSTFVPNWIAGFNTLQQDTLIFNWGIFQQNQISSLYLDNYGDTLTEIMLYVGIFLLALFFALFSKTEKLINSFIGKVYISTFSLLVANILGNMQGQILYSILQIIRIDLALTSNTYSILSLATGYLTMSLSTGLIIFCFFRLESIFNHKKRLKSSQVEASNNSDDSTQIRYEWLEKKYEFMFGDFKNIRTHQSFFAYWIIAFDVAYILLIFAFQSIPVLQCLSIVVLVLAFIIFSGIIKPFKKKTSAFLHFFNFSCVLVAGFMNLILAIIDAFSQDFSGAEIQGWLVVSVIILNTSVNTLFSLGLLVFEIYHKLKNKAKDLDKKSTTENPTVGVTSQNINPTIDVPPRALEQSLPNDSVFINRVYPHSNPNISQPTFPLRIIKRIPKPK